MQVKSVFAHSSKLW